MSDDTKARRMEIEGQIRALREELHNLTGRAVEDFQRKSNDGDCAVYRETEHGSETHVMRVGSEWSDDGVELPLFLTASMSGHPYERNGQSVVFATRCFLPYQPEMFRRTTADEFNTALANIRERLARITEDTP